MQGIGPLGCHERLHEEIMNLKKQLSLATQRLTEAEESIKATLHAARHVSAGSEHGNS